MWPYVLERRRRGYTEGQEAHEDVRSSFCPQEASRKVEDGVGRTKSTRGWAAGEQLPLERPGPRKRETGKVGERIRGRLSSRPPSQSQ